MLPDISQFLRRTPRKIVLSPGGYSQCYPSPHLYLVSSGNSFVSVPIDFDFNISAS